MFAVLAVVLVNSSIVPGGSAWAQSDLGTWLNTDKKGKIVLWECGTEGLCSKIVWLKEPNDENGRPWRDMLNPDPVKRNRPVMGVDVLEGLKKVGPNTWQGYIYDPEVGKRYYLKYIKIGTDKVEIRGCLSSGWPCRTKYWTRTAPLTPPAPNLQIAAPRPTPKAKRQIQQPPTLAQRMPQRATPPVVQRQASLQPPPPPPAVRAPASRTAVPKPVQRQASVQLPPPLPAVRAPAPRPAVPKPVQRHAKAQPPLPAIRPPVPAPVAPRPSAQAPLPWQGQVAKVVPAPAPYPPSVTGSVARPANVAPPGAPGYLVQVTAGQDQGEALRAFGKLQQLYPHLLGGYMPNIQKVNLGPKGVWYRVRVGPMVQRTAAVGFCQQLKSAGADCLIRRQ